MPVKQLIFTQLLTAALSAQAAAPATKLEFDVASVKANKSGSSQVGSNIPLGPGSVFPANGGHLVIQNIPLFGLIAFAYKITGDQEQALRLELPPWVQSERFDVEARSSASPTKDDMRMMMRALLADRFRAVIRTEERQLSIYNLVLLKEGKLGPRLRQHPAGDDACAPLPPSAEYPENCGGLLPMPHGPGRLSKFGARNVTVQFMANQLSIMGQLNRHVTDRTGLTGTFDFALEWSPEPNGGAGPAEASPSDDPPPGPGFSQALGTQLGLKLISAKGPVEILVVDHIERASGN